MRFHLTLRGCFAALCMTARRRECFADCTTLASVIPNVVRNPPYKIMPDGYSGQNVALARSRPGGCFAALCMTARRRKCFADCTQQSMCHSEPARNPLDAIMRDGCTASRCPSAITPRGMLRCALHDSNHLTSCHYERSEESPGARSCDGQTASNRGCFAALCMTARRRKCFADYTQQSIGQSEPARNPLR